MTGLPPCLITSIIASDYEFTGCMKGYEGILKLQNSLDTARNRTAASISRGFIRATIELFILSIKKKVHHG